MLQYETISKDTLELLKQIQKISSLSKMLLVGGTSLALQIGHRKSIDIDLFGKLNNDPYSLSEQLNKLGKIKLLRSDINIKTYLVNNIKVDIVNYPYKWIFPPIIIDGIKLAQLQDIAAMKLAAVCNRGSKKDFIDIAFLLKKYDLQELLIFYNKKFNDGEDFLVLKSLTWFEDAENEPTPVMLKNLSWDKVKTNIQKAVKEYIKNH